MSSVDFGRINTAALTILPTLLNRWLPDGRKPGRWADFATGDRGGDVISLAAYLHGLRQAEAARKLAEMLGLPS